MPQKKIKKTSPVPKETTAALNPEAWLQKYPGASPQARKLFWTGVIGFAVVIGGFWAISTELQISALAKRKAPESSLYDQVKQNWNTVFATNTTP